MMAYQRKTISAKQAKIILGYLQRTPMHGDDMPDYVDVYKTLNVIIAAGTKAEPTPPSQHRLSNVSTQGARTDA